MTSSPTKRRYNSPRRQAQAGQTRLHILQTARELFIQHGYAGATIEAIAQAAGVAPETIYATFGSKRALLAAQFRLAVGGDEQPVPLLQRPGPQAVLREPDPVLRLHLFAADIVHILERVAPLFAVTRAAARGEPEIDALLRGILADRLRTLSEFAASLPLRPGLDLASAGETVWALSSPELYSLLTVDNGWPQERYVEWLGDSLARLLL
ncbi:TetR/AcrR family transcriptional regulator [bacterium]|nr:MAG: TetR/AcrR family transcriptional regulator [bacterium]